MLTPILLLPEIVAIADAAGRIVMAHYENGTTVETKADSSPVTEADKAAEELILARLAALTPDIPVVAEEAVAAGARPDVGDGPFWLVDPLDGTREFISGNGEFTVNIALVVDRVPQLGVVGAPARGLMWWGSSGQGACRRENGEARAIAVRPRPAAGVVAVASRSHRDAATDAWLAKTGITDTTSAGSSLKFCLVAEGVADVYPRFGTTMEWDTGAGHAVLLAAGGRVTTEDDAALRYAKPSFRNPAFIAWGG